MKVSWLLWPLSWVLVWIVVGLREGDEINKIKCIYPQRRLRSSNSAETSTRRWWIRPSPQRFHSMCRLRPIPSFVTRTPSSFWNSTLESTTAVWNAARSLIHMKCCPIRSCTRCFRILRNWTRERTKWWRWRTWILGSKSNRDWCSRGLSKETCDIRWASFIEISRDCLRRKRLRKFSRNSTFPSISLNVL